MYEDGHANGRDSSNQLAHAARANSFQMKRFAFLTALLALLQACSSMTRSSIVPDANFANSESVIYVARRSWHIDVGFATAGIEPPLASTIVDFPSARYLFFGFGDKHYLVAKHQNFPGILAALWPGPGVLLVTALIAPPEEAFGGEHVVRLRVSAAQARAAQAFVSNSFLRHDAAPVRYGEGTYAGSLYFGAVSNYSAVYTCNTWAAEVLQAAGFPIHKAGVVFAAQLWSQVERIDARTHTRISARAASSAPRTATRSAR
jgi:Protein of unknown function (DUF2459)